MMEIRIVHTAGRKYGVMRENEEVRMTPRRDRLLITDKEETKVRRRQRNASLPSQRPGKGSTIQGEII